MLDVYSSCENEDEAECILRDAFGHEGDAGLHAEGVRRLMDRRGKTHGLYKRELALHCSNSFNFNSHPGTSRTRSLQDEFEEIVKEWFYLPLFGDSFDGVYLSS